MMSPETPSPQYECLCNKTFSHFLTELLTLNFSSEYNMTNGNQSHEFQVTWI